MNQITADFDDENFNELRKILITGTDVSDICCPVFGGAISVALSKRGYKKPKTEAMQEGLDHEEDVAIEVENLLKTGLKLDGKLLKAIKVFQPHTLYYHDGLSANPDVIALLSTGQFMLIELKYCQDLTNWKLEDTKYVKGRITKTGYQLGHYGYVLQTLTIEYNGKIYTMADFGLMVFTNKQSSTMHFELLHFDHAKAEANIEKTKRSLNMIEQDLTKEELLNLPIGNKDLDAAKDNLKTTFMDILGDGKGDKKTAYIEKTENTKAIADHILGMEKAIKEAELEVAKLKAYAYSKVNSELKSGIELELSIANSSETFDFKAVKDAKKVDDLKADFGDFFKIPDGKFSIKIKE